LSTFLLGIGQSRLEIVMKVNFRVWVIHVEPGLCFENLAFEDAEFIFIFFDYNDLFV
jgi:hypothetical protein